MTRFSARWPGRRLSGNRRGAVSLLFAIMVVPLLLICGIAVDFSFYIQASAELDLACDAAAMHAVRAMQMATANQTTYQNAGLLAGEQWFAAQAEQVPGVTLIGTGTPIPVTVDVAYTAPTYTATVTYKGTINTVFGRLVGVNTWPIAGTASATLSNNFVDLAMLLDISPSMWIGATQSDMNTIAAATPCAVVKTENGITPGDPMEAYDYKIPGYGYYSYETLPPYNPVTHAGSVIGNCSPNYIPGCTFMPEIIYGITGVYGTTGQYYLATANSKTGNKVGACNNGGGAFGGAGPNTPQAYCALACHQNSDTGDWYALARSLTNKTTGSTVQLRFDLVQAAAQQVLNAMIKYSPPPQTLLGVGIYTFSSSFQPLYPCSSTSGCASPFGNNLSTALADLSYCTGTQTTNCLPQPVSPVASPATDYATALSQAASFLTGSAGSGSSPATAKKNLFIVTDGINDVSYNGHQFVGPIDQVTANPCQGIKNQGFTIYVLYTTYYPLPTATYADTAMPASPAGTYPAGVTLQNYVTETNPNGFPNYNANYPTDSPVAAALRACASDPTYFYQASNATDINNALISMLASALNSAARVAN